MCSKQESMMAQARIRQLAEEQNNALKGFNTWEQSIKKRDKELRQADSIQNVTYSSNLSVTQSNTASNDVHHEENYGDIPISKLKDKGTSFLISPCTDAETNGIVVSKLENMKPHESSIESSSSKEDLAEAERVRGNDFFKNGSYNEAVKSYTKCIMMEWKLCTAYSNRGMVSLIFLLRRISCLNTSKDLRFQN